MEDEERDGAPEDDLEAADDGVGFVAVPSSELLYVLGGKHVGEQEEGFGALGVLVRGSVWMGFRRGAPCRGRLCWRGFAAGSS